MTVSSKWLRRALLGGVALGVTATGAQADELSALKAQLEALQSRVNQIEATGPAAAPALPEGASWITFNRGSQGSRLNEYSRPQEYIPEENGFTIAITPTADMPAPVHEVTVSGYVKGDLIYDTRTNLGDAFGISGVGTDTRGNREHVRLHARQSRFRIRSRSDTAVGQVRTLIEGDFFGAGGNQLFTNSTAFRLRHAWGEWDVTPNTTIGIGQTWTNFGNLFAAPDTVDFSGPVGMGLNNRNPQIRVTYTSGPIMFAVAVENPESDLAFNSFAAPTATGGVACAESIANPCEANDNVPDFTARLQYEAPGGHLFQVSGVVRNLRVDGDLSGPATATVTGSDSQLGWGIQADASINLADIATATVAATYGEGIGRYVVGGAFSPVLGSAANPNIRAVETLGLVAALSFGLTDTTTANVAFGYVNNNDSDTIQGQVHEMYTIHGNLMWQPVSRFRMGVEAMWGEADYDTAGHDDALRLQFGAWFFF
jgi:hypothetical protein